MESLKKYKDAYRERLVTLSQGTAREPFLALLETWRQIAFGLSVSEDDVVDFLTGYLLALPFNLKIYGSRLFKGDIIREKTSAFLKVIDLDEFTVHYPELIAWTKKAFKGQATTLFDENSPD
ncbi:MAG: hypothetical protein LBS60_08860 [Deltaproteobacteria bacterium]|jgi:hypothetical protein|nr:hypothetical protein [Deltaproteobacteria bacterium]